MADKTTSLVLDALTQASKKPEGQPLFGNKSSPGLFSTAVSSRLAAQLCKDEGYVRVVGSEKKGRKVWEICAITEKGLAHLAGQVSPRSVLENLLEALNARQTEINDLVNEVQNLRTRLDAFKSMTESALRNFDKPIGIPGPIPSTNGKSSLTRAILDFITLWQNSSALGDCPLTHIYRHLQQNHKTLSIGQFHDYVRELHEQQRIYLHPWTGPIQDLPEPSLALMIGHVLTYYISARGEG